MLILHPAQGPNKSSPNTTVKHRLQLFRQGKVQQLYLEAQQVPPAQGATTQADARAAQQAADEDNYSTAYHRLTASQPVATLTPKKKNKKSILTATALALSTRDKPTPFCQIP